VSDAGEHRPSCSHRFDAEFAVGAEGNNAYFGRNVLRGLVQGLDDFIHLRQARWERFRSMGPALLGSAMWIDDPELIDKLAELSGACIVVRKQGRRGRDVRKLEPLHKLNERTPGLPIRAFPGLGGLAPKVDGAPAVIGPYDSTEFGELPTIRTLGYRTGVDLVPIVHAKLALVGHLWWHDEGPLGHVDDIIGFTPKRLWVSSANFTLRSRHSLEFGYWTEDTALMDGAEDFLVELMGSSEALDPDADSLEPDLAPVDFDDEAMREAMAEMDWDDEDVG
jgi:hypothetical protein